MSPLAHLDSVPVSPPPFLTKTASVCTVVWVDRSDMDLVIINMLINTYSERQENSSLGPTAKASFRSSFLQLKLKVIKDASRERKKGAARPSVRRWLVGCASPGSQGH